MLSDASHTELTSRAVQVTPDLTVRPLAPGVLRHTSWRVLPDVGRFPSNGLVLLGPREAIVVDTAWGAELTEALFTHIERDLHRRITHLVVTHSHDDRIGGIREALRRHVAVHALTLTATRATADGLPPPTDPFERETAVDADGMRVEVFFPGAAHAPDNVVVWIPSQRILFGTCMVRSADARSLGNLADASVATWAASVRAVMARYPSPAIVVPGHGEPGDASLLTHTLDLVAAGR